MAKYHVSGTFTSDAYSYDLEADSQAEAIEKFKSIIGQQVLGIGVGDTPIKLRKVQVDVLGSIKSMVCLQFNGKTYIPTSQKGGSVDLLWDKGNDTDNILDKFWVCDNETISFSPRYGFFIIASSDYGKSKLGERISYIRSIVDENIYIDSANNECIELVSSDKKSEYTAYYASKDDIKPCSLHRLTSITIV